MSIGALYLVVNHVNQNRATKQTLLFQQAVNLIEATPDSFLGRFIQLQHLGRADSVLHLHSFRNRINAHRTEKVTKT